jgi:hypothetical protein
MARAAAAESAARGACHALRAPRQRRRPACVLAAAGEGRAARRAGGFPHARAPRLRARQHRRHHRAAAAPGALALLGGGGAGGARPGARAPRRAAGQRAHGGAARRQHQGSRRPFAAVLDLHPRRAAPGALAASPRARQRRRVRARAARIPAAGALGVPHGARVAVPAAARRGSPARHSARARVFRDPRRPRLAARPARAQRSRDRGLLRPGRARRLRSRVRARGVPLCRGLLGPFAQEVASTLY